MNRMREMCFLSVLVTVAISLFLALPGEAAPRRPTAPRTVIANVVALDQSIVYNRMGVVTPQGMIFALLRDIDACDANMANCVPATSPGAQVVPGQVRLRPDKRPRPIVLRMNAGDILEVRFQNLLAPTRKNLEQPATRSASFHVMGLQLAGGIASDGSAVGNNPSSLAGPGETRNYSYFAEREGTFLAYTNGAVAGGESELGGISIGLFGSVNVQARGAEWYRSQVTSDDLQRASIPCVNGQSRTADGHPCINYDARYADGRFAGSYILKMLSDENEIIHSDINAIITGPNKGNFPDGTYPAVAALTTPGGDDAIPRKREEPFREFTIVFHDEIHVVQAFPQFQERVNAAGIDENPLSHTLHSVRDGFAINYGTGGIGAEILANRVGLGPMADCAECKYEEFFLTSWAVGDPAMVVDRPVSLNLDPATGAPVAQPVAARKAFFPDDPSNVFHSYLNDHVKMRNLHAGKEHHMFHLHAHQWLYTPDDDNASYMDVQGLGPGSSYVYEIAHNGSGNRNLTPGDSIFHCHFYPHFAQGMWSLWRVHDTFEEGTRMEADPLDPLGAPIPASGSRALPDGEILAGTPIPALVPLPGRPMAPVPGAVEIVQEAGLPGGQARIVDPGKNPGYPFFIAAKAGHRPPKPPLDTLHDGGLPRHIITGGAQGDASTLHVESRLSMDKKLVAVTASAVPEDGTDVEKIAMDFHSRRFHPSFLPDGTPAGDVNNPNLGFKTNGRPAIAGAPYADPCLDDSGNEAGLPGRQIQAAAFQLDMIMNKLGWHFPQSRILAHWQDVGDILNRVKPTEPFFFRANSDDCIVFHHTNLVPHIYEADDYQVRTPTDVIGQHIHLVKFDVTSSDGSGNGFNYEDGTFSPLEVQERIAAINQGQGGLNGQALAAQAHPFFQNLSFPGLDTLGAQTTIQRWYADPTVNNKGEDRTLGTVFTHDHFGPSTHQQAGLYAFLGVEPKGSSWRDPETGAPFGIREDGGPTSFRADIITAGDGVESYREFFMFLADFQPAYAEGPLEPLEDPAHAAVFGEAVVGHSNHELAIGPAATEQAPLPIVVGKADVCPDGVNPPPCPEAIMAADEGTMVVNYRNEPVAHRIANAALTAQAAGQAGDLGFVYRSDVTREIPELNVQPSFFTNPLTLGVNAGDPFTPLLRVNQGDKMTIRLGVGANEESHNATVHGFRWLQNPFSPNSGYRNHQNLGIAEHFELSTPIVPAEHTGAEPVDHLYKFGAAVDSQWNGTWGLIRAYSRDDNDQLLPLPNNLPRPVTISNTDEFNGVCPKKARPRQYDVTAVTAADALPLASLSGIDLTGNPEIGRDVGTLIYNRRAGHQSSPVKGPLNDPSAILYVRTSDLDANGKLLANVPVEPLILRAAAGECIEVTLRNRLPADPEPLLDPAGFHHFPPIIHFPLNGQGINANQVKTSKEVGLHPQLVSFDTSLGDGTNVGGNRRADGVVNKQTAGPGETVTYRWYAGILTQGADNRLVATPVEFGATGLIPADPIKQSGKGLVGALIIEPPRARWVEDRKTRATARVRAPGVRAFSEHVLVLQDGIDLLDSSGVVVPSAPVEEDAEDSGKEGVNYRAEPNWFRLGYAPNSIPELVNDLDFKDLFSNTLTGGLDPETPVFTVRRRTPTRFRVVDPGSQMRNQVFVLHGHTWERLPYTNNSTRLGDNPLSEWLGSQEGIGAYAHHNFLLKNGAGGKFAIAGDYLFRDFSPFTFVGGVWGILRVR